MEFRWGKVVKLFLYHLLMVVIKIFLEAVERSVLQEFWQCIFCVGFFVDYRDERRCVVIEDSFKLCLM